MHMSYISQWLRILKLNCEYTQRNLSNYRIPVISKKISEAINMELGKTQRFSQPPRYSEYYTQK